MNGVITKIDQPKFASDRTNVFYRLYFKMEDGSWAHTDVVPRFRNFKFWRPIIQAGVDTTVGNLKYKYGSTTKIDADCRPHIVQPELEDKQEKLL